MGNLINPVSSRLGYVKYWNSVWAVSQKLDYSLNSTFDFFCRLYLNKLFTKFFLVNENNKKSVNISYYKIVKQLNNFYVFVYFDAYAFEKESDFASKLFYKAVQKHLQKKVETVKNKKLKAKKLGVKNKKLSNKKLKRNIRYLFRSYPLLKRGRKKSKYINKKNTLRYKKIKSMNFLRNTKKVAAFDFRRRQTISYVNLVRTSLILKTQYESALKKKITNTKILKLNFVWTFLTDYLFYVRRLKLIKKYLTINMLKFLTTNISLKCVFIRQTASKISADIITYYITTRLQMNFPLRRLVKTIVKQLTFEIKNANILGFKIVCSGRFERRGRASYEWRSIGKIGNTNFDLLLDYSLKLVTLTNSICAVKIWLVKVNQNEKIFIL